MRIKQQQNNAPKTHQRQCILHNFIENLMDGIKQKTTSSVTYAF